MQKIAPCLWFDGQAEEAANFYVSVFKNSKIISKVENKAENPSQVPVGSVLVVNFELDGEEFMALNGGPFFKFNEAVSFVVKCKDQEEIDYYWEKLSVVPEAEQCGWLKDKFGLSWQVVPENMGELVNNEKSMQAMLDMKKDHYQGSPKRRLINNIQFVNCVTAFLQKTCFTSSIFKDKRGGEK